MTNLKSSLLLVAHPDPATITLGADFVENFAQAQIALKQNPYAVVAFSLTSGDAPTLREFIQSLKSTNHDSQIVVVTNGAPAEFLKETVNLGSVFRVMRDYRDPLFQRTLQEALDEKKFVEQNQQLFSLLQEQHSKLQQLSSELEERVEKRQSFLTAAREKALETSRRIEALNRALVAIHRANSIGEIEALVLAALEQVLQLQWIRILFRSQNFFSQQSEINKKEYYEIFSAPLVKGQDHLGQIYFARDKTQIFKKTDHAFLFQIADAVALAIDRLVAFEQTEILKQQWESTFDAIAKPISLVNRDYEIVRCNQSFAKKAAKAPEQIVGRKCYEVLFARQNPCRQCQLGKAFRLTPKKTASGESFTFEVSSQTMQFEPGQAPYYAMIYNDISAQARLERQIVESAKMAELGTISSSIAHELNNPLGGMISFLQLIRMDLKGNEAFFSDIVEMEESAQRCKEIVQNLLTYAREASDQIQRTDLSTVAQRAVKLNELHSRSRGIELEIGLPNETCFIEGQFNLLSQAMSQIIQLFTSDLVRHMNEKNGFSGKVTLNLRADTNSYIVDFTSNQEQPRTQSGPGLDLRVCEYIVSEHSGTLELLPNPENFTTVRLTFPRPEIQVSPTL